MRPQALWDAKLGHEDNHAHFTGIDLGGRHSWHVGRGPGAAGREASLRRATRNGGRRADGDRIADHAAAGGGDYWEDGNEIIKRALSERRRCRVRKLPATPDQPITRTLLRFPKQRTRFRLELLGAASLARMAVHWRGAKYPHAVAAPLSLSTVEAVSIAPPCLRPGWNGPGCGRD